MSFTLNTDQQEKLFNWIEEQDRKVCQMQESDSPYYGSIAGGYSYIFTPTSIGVIIVVKNYLTKEEIDLTEYENF